jgi:ribosomal protein S18 acetylase RimI-like enzyme
MATNVKIRVATVDEGDLEAIVRHRRAMFFDMGHCDEKALEAMTVRFRPWLKGKMEAGEYLGWFAIGPDGSIAAGLGLWLMDWPPHLVGAGKWRGNILNVYAEPAYRRQGMARALMQEGMGWCRANGVGTVILHASEEGRTLYESLGFTATNEMRIVLGGE